MRERDQYPAGVPRWVETLQPQPQAAVDFYGPLFGWEFSEPEPMPGGMPGDYFVARVDGRQVAGVGTLPDLGGPSMAVWNTYVGVDSVEQSVDRVKAAGGNVLMGPLEGIPSGHFAVLADATGAPSPEPAFALPNRSLTFDAELAPNLMAEHLAAVADESWDRPLTLPDRGAAAPASRPRATPAAQVGQRCRAAPALPERLAMRHSAPDEPLLWMLVRSQRPRGAVMERTGFPGQGGR